MVGGFYGRAGKLGTIEVWVGAAWRNTFKSSRFVRGAEHRLMAIYKRPLDVELLRHDTQRLLAADGDELFRLAAIFFRPRH